jgi:hypothetical protein
MKTVWRTEKLDFSIIEAKNLYQHKGTRTPESQQEKPGGVKEP